MNHYGYGAGLLELRARVRRFVEAECMPRERRA